jgi:tRNA (uracil-5-)-methyltransferase TRM9
VLVGSKVEQQGINSGRNDILTIGLDRSANLIDLALNNQVIGERVPKIVKEAKEGKRNEVSVGDAIQSNFRSACFDYALSIATIHHFSTKERRLQAVKELIRIVKPISRSLIENLQEREEDSQYPDIAQNSAGRFLIYVWALEQRGESRRKFEAVQKDEDESGKDLLVPWVLSNAGKAVSVDVSQIDHS